MFDYSREPGKELKKDYIKKQIHPLVSIITPYYNTGKEFEQTFNCVINQTFPWFEWIVVDDGSTNITSLENLKRYASRDSRIIVYRKENGGISSARNFGIQKAQSNIIIPLDGDDLIIPTYVEILFWALETHQDASWAYTDCVGFGAEEYLWEKPFSTMKMKEENLLVCTAAIRKEALEKVGYYQELGKHFNEDWYTWLALLSKGMYPVHIPVKGFWYRRSDTGVLHIVKEDPIVKEKNKRLITAIAKEVKTEVSFIEYPHSQVKDQYRIPTFKEWPVRTFDENKKHILMLLPWLEMGGADLFNLHLVQRINKEKYSFSIVTMQPSQNTWQERFEDQIDEIYNLPQFLDVQDYVNFISYYIQTRHIDILFVSNSYFGYQLLPWIRKEFPDLAIIDYVHMEEWYWRNGGFARISAAMGDVIDHTYVCNGKTQKVIAKDLKRGENVVDTLYIGVDDKEYDPSLVETGKVFERFGINNERPIVLFPCRIHPQKRPFLMLEIAKQLKTDTPKPAFVVVGDGPQLTELKEVIQKENLEDMVFLAGRQNNMKPYYKDATVVLICSLKEGLALTAYEALSMATPVVTSDVGGQAELVSDDTGMVIPLIQEERTSLDNHTYSEKEITSYVSSIRYILSDPEKYKIICNNCRQRILDSFSVNIMIQKMESIFDEVCQNPQMLEKRRAVAKKLKDLEAFTNEYTVISTEFALLDMQTDEIWKAKEYFQKKAEENEKWKKEAEEVWSSREYYRILYEQKLQDNPEIVQKQDAVTAHSIETSGNANSELEYIKSTRSYQIMMKYQHFMDKTKLGKGISKIRNGIFKRRSE